MFDWLLEKEEEEDEEEEVEEEEVEEEEEGEEPEDEQTVFFNKEITECFALFDKNKTGNMESRHLQKALDCLGIFLTPMELSDLVEELENNGVIPFESFRAYAFDMMVACDQVEALRIAFQAFDPDKEGVLNAERLKRWLTTLGDPLTEKEAKELVKIGDPAGKGIVAYDDLIMIILKK